MTPHQFVAVAIRLFALWLALLSVQSLMSLLALMPGVSWVVYVAYAALYGTLALVLWFFPMTIAGRLLSSTPVATPHTLTPTSIVHAAIICTGFVLLADSLPPLFNQLAFALAARSAGYGDASERQIILISFAIHLSQLALSMFMIFRAQNVARRISPRTQDGDL